MKSTLHMNELFKRKLSITSEKEEETIEQITEIEEIDIPEIFADPTYDSTF